MKKKYLEPVILALLVVIAAVTVASCRKQADDKEAIRLLLHKVKSQDPLDK